MHPENAIDNGDFIKILVYKFILVAKAQFVESKSGWGKFRTGGVKGVNHLPQG